MFWNIISYFYGFFGTKTSSATSSANGLTTANIPTSINISEAPPIQTTQEQQIIQEQPIQTIDEYSQDKEITTDGVKLALRKFNIDKIRKHSTILVIGKKMSGKTTLVKYLMKQCKLDRGLAIGQSFTDTSDMDMPLDNIIFKDEYKPKLIESFVNALKAVKNNPDRALILDDCVYDAKSWSNSSELKWLFMNNRFVRTALLISTTGHYNIPPACRANVDYVFLLNEPSVQRKKQLWECFGGVVPTYAAFEHIMNKCTSDYSCLVVDNTSRSGKVEDTLFWLNLQSE